MLVYSEACLMVDGLCDLLDTRGRRVVTLAEEA